MDWLITIQETVKITTLLIYILLSPFRRPHPAGCSYDNSVCLQTQLPSMANNKECSCLGKSHYFGKTERQNTLRCASSLREHTPKLNSSYVLSILKIGKWGFPVVGSHCTYMCYSPLDTGTFEHLNGCTCIKYGRFEATEMTVSRQDINIIKQ